MSTVDLEHVLVVPTAEFHRLGHFQGFRGGQDATDRYLRELLSPAHVTYQRRSKMEQDPSFKQLIPYVIFEYDDAEAGLMLFQYTRGAGQGESRLHAKRSVGVGGHISVEDAMAKGDDPYQEGLRRELEEEVQVDSEGQMEMVGLINDDESEVGRVHLGVVHLFRLERPEVRSREEDLCDAGFAPVAQLLRELPHFETWSQICLQALYG